MTNANEPHGARQRLIEILENTSDLVGTATPDTRLTYMKPGRSTPVGMGNP